MTHASRIADQLRIAEQDEDLPDEVRESARERRESIEDDEEQEQEVDA